MKVVAALSGGVDSAVAAARAVDAGHDVVGVHLALSRIARDAPQRVARLLHARGRARRRRIADVLGIPFYVWDLADEFRADVVDDFVAEYAAGRTPNPCIRCNETIKFAAVLDRARRAGLRRRLHRSLRADRSTTSTASLELRRGVDPAKDQSYVLGVVSRRRPRCTAMFPLGDSVKDEVRRRGRRARTAGGRRSPTATTSASSPTATPARSCARARRAAGQRRRRAGCRGRGAPGRLRVHGRASVAVCPRAIRRPMVAPLRARRSSRSTERRHGRARGAARGPAHRARARGRWCRRRLDASSDELLVQWRAHGSAVPARAVGGASDCAVELAEPAFGIAAGQELVMYRGERVVARPGSASAVPLPA